MMVLVSRKSISYRTGRYGRNLPYRCLGRNRNMTVSFYSKYWVIPGCTGRFGKNTGYRPENENWPVKCKPMKKKKKEKERYPNTYCCFHFSGSDATSPIIIHLLFVFGSSSSSSSFVQSCSTSVSLLRALAVGLPYAKCKVHLAFKPKKFSATKRPNLGKAKFFWHSATVPS